MQNSYSHQPPSPQSVQVNSVNQADTVAIGNAITTFLLFFLPICLIVGAIVQKKYHAHRAAVLRQQIETLEMMWRISPKH